jgi:multiple sugar transport system substrate-binding protein
VLATFAAVPGVPAEAVDALKTVTVRLELPMDPNVGAYEQILNEEHDLIMTNSLSVADGIAEINKRVAEIVK